MTLFVRLGSDYTQHYYEYSLPLTLTPAGRYSSLSPSDRRRVWPEENSIDLSLEDLVALKRSRNASLSAGLGGASLYRPFSHPDAKRPTHTLTVLGNPSLSSVRALVIGVRNSAGLTRSVEVWVNELRASDYHEEAGWAGQLHSTLQLAELGEASLRAQYISAGFGAIDAPLMSRTLESRRAIQFASTLEFGQLLPPEAKVTLPIYYTVSDEVLTPQYNPLDEDVKLTDALSDLSTERERKELRARSLTHRRSQGLALSKVAVGIPLRGAYALRPCEPLFQLWAQYLLRGDSRHRVQPSPRLARSPALRLYTYLPPAKALCEGFGLQPVGGLPPPVHLHSVAQPSRPRDLDGATLR